MDACAYDDVTALVYTMRPLSVVDTAGSELNLELNMHERNTDVRTSTYTSSICGPTIASWR